MTILAGIYGNPTFLDPILVLSVGLRHLIQSRRAFLKRPKNFSGPKTFRGCFRARFSGSGKCFSKCPIFSRDFRGFFRKYNGRNSVSFNFPAYDWFKNCKLHCCSELGSSQTHQIQDFFEESQSFISSIFVQF